MARGVRAAALGMALALAAAASGKAGPAEDDAALADCLAGHSEAAFCKGAVYGPCLALPERQSTVGEASCYREEGEAWDRLLNTHYQRLMELLDPEQRTALRDAQRAWIAFRDAHCGFGDVLVRGTYAQVWGAACFSETTADRVEDLRGYLDYVGG